MRQLGIIDELRRIHAERQRLGTNRLVWPCFQRAPATNDHAEDPVTALAASLTSTGYAFLAAANPTKALAAFGADAKKKAASDCSVTSTWPDGRTEERECTIQGDEFLKPACAPATAAPTSARAQPLTTGPCCERRTKGKFQSCTR